MCVCGGGGRGGCNESRVKGGRSSPAQYWLCHLAARVTSRAPLCYCFPCGLLTSLLLSSFDSLTFSSAEGVVSLCYWMGNTVLGLNLSATD